jgi:Tol biopolymer transport system component
VQRRLRFLVSLALVAIAALSLGAATAFAGPKEIAYVCKGEDICLLDPDTPSPVTNLTDDGITSYESDPVWSPDGKRLAFVAQFPGLASEDIYTMEPEGADQTFNLATQVTHFVGVAAITEIAWSPDGSKIAFVRSAGFGPGSNPVYVVNANGSSASATVISAASGGGGTPTWAPDSAKIAFWHGNQIYTVPGDASSAATPLVGATCQEPAWSPEGSKIACGNFRSNVQIYGSTGGLPLSTISNYSQWTFGAWSPSAAQLAYREESGENAYFRIVNADGSGNHGLPIVQSLNADSPPSWSPDGARLVFDGHYFGGGESTNEVYVANADGSGSVTALTPDQGGGHSTEPAWKPNPVAHPGPQVITPSGPGGSNAPLPGPTVKPTVKWFTNRVFWTYAPYVPMLSVGCDAPVCNVGGTGTSKSSVAAGIRPRPALATASSSKPTASKKKPKTIVVAKGKVRVTAGQTRILKLKLTKLAIAILEKVGKLKMSVSVTVAIAGQAPFKETRSIEVVAKQKPKKKH